MHNSEMMHVEMNEPLMVQLNPQHRSSYQGQHLLLLASHDDEDLYA